MISSRGIELESLALAFCSGKRQQSHTARSLDCCC
jgi:hypothetical protein